MATQVKDFGGIIQAVYDPTTQTLGVNIQGGSPSLPSIVRLTDGTNYITTTAAGGGKTAMDVNITSALDVIINQSTDSIAIGDGTHLLTSTAVSGKQALDINIVASIGYITLIDDTVAGTTYIGKAMPGSITSAAVWQILKMTTSAGNTNILYANGSTSFANIWDNRVSLAYS